MNAAAGAASACAESIARWQGARASRVALLVVQVREVERRQRRRVRVPGRDRELIRGTGPAASPCSAGDIPAAMPLLCEGCAMAAASRSSYLRVGTWVLHMVLPLLGLWLLYAQPGADVRWENHHAHFALVLGMSAISVGLALQIGREGVRRDDARLLLIAQSFGLSAGFLAVHAIATPAVVVNGRNAAFDLALPVGLALASIPALASALELSGERRDAVLRHRQWSWIAVIALVVVAIVASVMGFGTWGDPLAPGDADIVLGALAGAGGVLYLLAAAGYYRRFRERPGAVLLSVITAFVLLAEALLTTALARNWQLSWWEWHALLITGYAFVAYTVHNEYRREGDARGLFASISLEQTVRDLRAQYNAALEGLVDAIREGADRGEPVTVGRVRAALAARFDLTEGQGRVLERAAESLAADRDQIRALNALVEIGGNTRIGVGERELLAVADRLVRGAFPRDDLRIGLLDDGVLRRVGDGGRLEPWPDDDQGERFALQVQGRPAGVIEIRRAGPVSERERSVLASLASQLSTAVENARLYVQLDGLFRSYLSPEVAASLLADPGRAALGGTIHEVTILMADLQGFTPFSERSSPTQVIEMLNTYWSATVPVILAEGGTITQFVGDAVMALFGAPAAQPDHARRAARAALAVQSAAADVLADHPDWPRFRVGLNTGPAIVGNVGSEDLRNFSAIGDTTNVAARLEGAAPAGGVLIGARTYELLGPGAQVRAVAPLKLKGKAEPVSAYVLEAAS